MTAPAGDGQGSLPSICVACGNDQPCALCGGDVRDVVWSRAEAVPSSSRVAPIERVAAWFRGRRHAERFDFVSDTAEGHVEIVAGAVRFGYGEVRRRRSVSAGELEIGLGALGSQRMVAFPIDFEGLPSREDRATGAFVSALIGMAARGQLRLALELHRAWERTGRAVFQHNLGRVPTLWIQRGEQWSPDASGPPLESAVLRALAQAEPEASYRDVRHPWLALGHLIEEHRWAIPPRRSLALHAELAAPEIEQAAERLEEAWPELISGLAALSYELAH